MGIYEPESKYRKYCSVREQIRELIQGAEDGTRLLPETELSHRFSVSRPTIRKAIDELVEAGLLKRVPGNGVFVSTPPLEQLNLVLVCEDSEETFSAFTNNMYRHIETTLVARGGNLTTLPIDPLADALPEAYRDADGYILSMAHNPNFVPAGKPAVVLLTAHHLIPYSSTVLVDDYLGGRLAAEYLINNGHRRLAYVGHLQSAPIRDFWQHERFTGVFDATTVAHLPHALCLDTGGAPVHPEMLLPLKEEGITGVVCANDDLAIATISCLHKVGIHVPEEMSVIGFDDIPSAGLFVPQLTTVKLPSQLIAQTVIEQIIQLIKTPEIARLNNRVMVPVEIIERESCRTVSETEQPASLVTA